MSPKTMLLEDVDIFKEENPGMYDISPIGLIMMLIIIIPIILMMIIIRTCEKIQTNY